MNKRNLSTKTLLKNTVAAVSETITKHIPLKKFATTHGIRFYSDSNNPIFNKTGKY